MHTLLRRAFVLRDSDGWPRIRICATKPPMADLRTSSSSSVRSAWNFSSESCPSATSAPASPLTQAIRRLHSPVELLPDHRAVRAHREQALFEDIENILKSHLNKPMDPSKPGILSRLAGAAAPVSIAERKRDTVALSEKRSLVGRSEVRATHVCYGFFALTT